MGALHQNITYSYINDTHLSMVSGNGNTYQLLYDALGRCVVRILNGAVTYYIYDGEKAILEYRSWPNPSASNVYGRGIDEILMRTDYSVTPTRTLFYQDDHEGSITHLTDSSGNVIESYRYDAFGKPTIFDPSLVTRPSSLFNNRFMFTGREYVQTFGFYEYRNRAYHPGLGRFMSEDPKGFDAGDYNLFRYVHNDPEDLTDPMGLDDPVRTPDANGLLQTPRLTNAEYLSRGVHVAWFTEHPFAAQHVEQKGISLDRGPVDFNISMGNDPRQNWNRDIHAEVFSGGHDPTDRHKPVFLDHKLGPHEIAAALPGGDEMRGKSIDAAYKGVRQNGIGVGDKGPHFNDTPRYPADRYWNTGARPVAESKFRNPAGIDLSPQVWRNWGFQIRYDQNGVPYAYSPRDPNPVVDWRWH